MAVSTVYTYFFRKAHSAWQLTDMAAAKPVKVEVSKVIQLTEDQYQHFTTHLLEDMPFIEANRTLTDCDAQGVNHCLLITTRGRRGGLLVDCQGHNYARYTAYVADKAFLDLQDVPVDHYDLKLRQPPNRQEQR